MTEAPKITVRRDRNSKMFRPACTCGWVGQVNWFHRKNAVWAGERHIDSHYPKASKR